MDDSKLQDELIRRLLSEVIEEETVSLLEEVIIEDEPGEPLTSSEINQKENLLARQIGDEILGVVLFEDFPAIAGECFDDVIAGHRMDLNAVQSVNSLLQYVIQEMVEEIVLDVVGENISLAECEVALESLLSEVIFEECKTTSSKVIGHYHMRVALSQYKQIQASAGGFLMDKLLLNALMLPYSENSDKTNTKGKSFVVLSEESDKILNDIVFDILLSQSLALHSCFPKNLPTKVFKDVQSLKLQPAECMPLNWYKDKLVTSVAEDVVLTMLCGRLDESMQFSGEEHLKHEAVSLVAELLNN